jgi:hypothetical protein
VLERPHGIRVVVACHSVVEHTSKNVWQSHIDDHQMLCACLSDQSKARTAATFKSQATNLRVQTHAHYHPTGQCRRASHSSKRRCPWKGPPISEECTREQREERRNDEKHEQAAHSTLNDTCRANDTPFSKSHCSTSYLQRRTVGGRRRKQGKHSRINSQA